jgi:hypothetical protein
MTYVGKLGELVLPRTSCIMFENGDEQDAYKDPPLLLWVFNFNE